uniref:T9SS type A sorting domain-containing protein n=1 Tax=Rhodohalobacter sp. SW132 TaxID=2293433 RepID=UPI000E367709
GSSHGDDGDSTSSVDIPVLYAPVHHGVEVSVTPSFEWSDAGADYYVLQLTGNGVNVDVTVKDTSYTLNNNLLETGETYEWRVRGVKDSVEGKWSRVYTFETDTDSRALTSVDGEAPLETAIEQNYPNPFNPSTQIEFTLSELQNVTLSVYDMAGRQVAVLVDGMRQAGRHSASFHADHMASGVYFYRLVTETQSFTMKMTLLK